MINNPYIFGSGGSQNFSFSTAGLFQYPPTVKVPNTVTSMTASAASMQQHSEIEKIIFESGSPSTFRYLPAQCFYNCYGLKEITLPDSLVGIQGSTFSGCRALQKVNLAAGQTLTVSTNEFYDCRALTQASFEDIIDALASSVTMLPASMFYNCQQITNFKLPSRITQVNNNVFHQCVSLVTAELPSVTTVQAAVFAGCTSLITLIYGSVLDTSSKAYINHASSSNVVYNCTALQDVQIPQGWKQDMKLSDGGATWTNVLTHDSMLIMLDHLYDFTGDQQTHTLTLGATNLARLSAAEKQVATDKNWTLA